MTALATEPVSAATSRGELPPSMVERMTLILDAFEGPSTRLTLENVARRTHLPRSTAHRILDQLVRLSWLEHTNFGYRLGQRALGLGGRGGGCEEIRGAAAPLLHQLAIRTGMVVHLAVLEGAAVYYLDKVGGRFATAVPSRVGGRAPAHSTALGKAILARMQPEEIDAQIGQSMRRLTSRTIGDLNVLHQELNRIRARHGLAFERGECFAHISCVAAAIRGPEGPLASISLVGDARAPLEKVAPLVVDAARKVSLTLHPNLESGRRRCPVRSDADRTWSASTLDRLMLAGENGDWL